MKLFVVITNTVHSNYGGSPEDRLVMVELTDEQVAKLKLKDGGWEYYSKAVIGGFPNV